MKKMPIMFFLLASGLISNPLDAQEQGAKQGGMFGYSTNNIEANSLLNRNNSSNYQIGLQGFGEDQNDLTLQSFGEETPMGNGMLILIAAGIGYAARKKQTSKTNQNGKENK